MYQFDMDKLLSTRHDNGADFWATPDGKIGIEKPISTLTALLVMSELKVQKTHEALQGAAELVLGAVRDDGRVRISPKGSIYTCHMALAAAALSRNGYAGEKRVKTILEYLLTNRYEDGGWRCNKFSYGRGPETNFSNPGVTLVVLDAFRCAGIHQETKELDRAVETLLDHWTVRIPIGPCHHGMGALFMQVEYPFLRYNLFYYVYVLSFYPKARKDNRFKEAFESLSNKLDINGRLIVERPNRKLEKLNICRKGEPSEAATGRYLEIVKNMKQIIAK
ncbi:MAG: prenyltransferase [Eubacteriales bacterium]|nr:prenyltransferase [Eubacteriales bacterium]